MSITKAHNGLREALRRMNLQRPDIAALRSGQSLAVPIDSQRCIAAAMQDAITSLADCAVLFNTSSDLLKLREDKQAQRITREEYLERRGWLWNDLADNISTIVARSMEAPAHVDPL